MFNCAWGPDALALLRQARRARRRRCTLRPAPLEVHSFPGRVGGDEHAQRMRGRIGIECPLHILPAFVCHAAVERRHAWVRLPARCELRTKLLFQIALRVAVLREDEHSALFVGANPVDEVLDARVRQAANGVGRFRHPRQQLSLARVGTGASLSHPSRRRRLHRRVFLFPNLLFRDIRAVIVCIR